MHAYRTHTCGALRASDAGIAARLSGWVHSKRDHGGLLFIDLRDHFGITQIVFAAGAAAFADADAVRAESVVTVTGQVVMREAGTANPRLPTGEIELRAERLVVQSAAEVLPIQVAGEASSISARVRWREDLSISAAISGAGAPASRRARSRVKRSSRPFTRALSRARSGPSTAESPRGTRR